MPNKLTKILVATCAVAALSALLAPAASASQRSFPVDLRIATADGRTIAEHRQYTRDTMLRTSPAANCFGTGTGGSGDRVRVGGLTALGTIAQAALYSPGLRPLLITDHDFGFPGLGICGIGGPIPAGEFWFVKTDRQNPQVSGDQAEVRPRGSVLWYLMPWSDCDPDPPFACASELVLRAPVRAQPGREFRVRVTAYDDAGDRTAVEGAQVSGAAEPTDANGFATVSLPRSARIRATHPGDAPSEALSICVSARPASCPAARGMRIMGSSGNDRIVGTRGPDTIRTGPGNNLVNVRGGGRDRVVCGRGRNVVLADRTDVVRGCAVVRRR